MDWNTMRAFRRLPWLTIERPFAAGVRASWWSTQYIAEQSIFNS